MSPAARIRWAIPAALIALSLVPALAGGSRLVQLAGGAAITPDNARFFASPLPVVLHILGSLPYSFLGAFQVTPGLRGKHPGRHRILGLAAFPCGLAAALSGLWMAQVYPRPLYDGTALYLMRMAVGSAMTLFLILGLAALLRRRPHPHAAWMIRAYALGLGAGTQVLTHLPWFLFPGIRGEASRALFMGAGWALNLAVAESMLRWGMGRKHRRST